jgi:hypothetical protein
VPNAETGPKGIFFKGLARTCVVKVYRQSLERTKKLSPCSFSIIPRNLLPLVLEWSRFALTRILSICLTDAAFSENALMSINVYALISSKRRSQ